MTMIENSIRIASKRITYSTVTSILSYSCNVSQCYNFMVIKAWDILVSRCTDYYDITEMIPYMAFYVYYVNYIDQSHVI